MVVLGSLWGFRTIELNGRLEIFTPGDQQKDGPPSEVAQKELQALNSYPPEHSPWKSCRWKTTFLLGFGLWQWTSLGGGFKHLVRLLASCDRIKSWFQRFVLFTQILGEMIQFDQQKIQIGFSSTTNYCSSHVWWLVGCGWEAHKKTHGWNQKRKRNILDNSLTKQNNPGDSSRDLFIPGWRSRTTIWKGHVNSPSQKGHDRRIARIWFISLYCSTLSSHLDHHIWMGIYIKNQSFFSHTHTPKVQC